MINLLWLLTWGGCIDQGVQANVYHNKELIAQKVEAESFDIGAKLIGTYSVSCVRDTDETPQVTASTPKLSKPGFVKIVSEK